MFVGVGRRGGHGVGYANQITSLLVAQFIDLAAPNRKPVYKTADNDNRDDDDLEHRSRLFILSNPFPQL